MGMAAARDVDGVVRELAVLQPANDTFPGEALLELAADALELSGASRAEPLDYSAIRERCPRSSSGAGTSITRATTPSAQRA